MRRFLNRKTGRGIWMLALAILILVPAMAFAGPNTPVSGAAFTTVNEAVDGTGHCQNGNPNINCNIYDGKQYVWLNGGPSVAYVGDGDYFFAVLDPGGQADPNDGAAKNLSDDFDTYTNRTFHVSNGVVTYTGTHDFNNNKIRLMPYDDTTNPGGVYILAICLLADIYPANASDCKYDAFKVQKDEIQPGLPLTITKDANGANTNTFVWGISKDVDKTEAHIASGGAATFNYTVSVTHDAGTIGNVKVTGTISVFNPNVDSNNNTVPATIDGISDTLSDGTACSITNGGSQTLTQFQTDFAYTCTLSALPQGELDNNASVSWPQQFLDNGALLDASSANFTFKSIAFAETKLDDCVSVADTLGGSLGQVCSGDPSPKSFTYPLSFSGVGGTCTDYPNTATFTTNTSGTTGSGSQTVKVCVGVDLTVSKTANPSFTRIYDWNISKAAGKTLIKQVGGTATFNYTVIANQTGFTDSNWKVQGVITVVNPNDWQAITFDIADVVNNGGSCTIDGGGTGLTVNPSDSLTASYTCSYASAPSPSSGTNTATASWDAAAAFTPTGSAQGTAGFAFGAPTTRINQTIHVADSYAGPLGDVTATDAQPFASKSFTYARTVNVPAFGCVTYPNTATIVETGQSASQAVTVCGPIKTGALTMGFWQNPNGQGIIKAGAATAGVCNSGTWLRQFLPFQDLGTTATCAQVATYVTNVIKAANASGAAMNAMLKGQMLATALDVYFSDPALGGNKISAPAPIGGVTIDLTKICKNIGGGCTIYENTSSAFGGATSLTVSQLLSYAASQSNAGGSNWYGQVKATQELAKDTFDAINNEKVFAP